MLRLTLAQLRASVGRLVASALAVVIAVAFVVATLVVSATASATVRTAVAAPLVDAAAVVLLPGQDVPDPDRAAGVVDAVRGVDGVADVAVDSSLYVDLAGEGAQRTYAQVDSVPPAGPLRWQVLSAGRLPEGPGEVAVAGRVDAEVGDRLSVVPPPDPSATTTGPQTDPQTDPETDPQTDLGDVAPPEPQDVEVVGVVDLGGDPTASFLPRLFASPEQVAAWGGTADQLRVAPEPGADGPALVAAVDEAATRVLGPDAEVRSAADQTDVLVEDLTGGALQLVGLLLVFAAVSVLVAGLVIANTFAVLLAQRTRELALLRCVGATAAQVRRGVLLEALATGLVASAAGVLVGVGLAAAASAVGSAVDSPVPLAGLAVPVSAVAVGMVLGTVVTLVAALAPARAATRVPPLAAMRPLDPVPVRSRGGLARLVLGLVLLVPGAAVLAYGALTGSLLVGLAGGLPTALGVVLLCQRVVPPLVGLTGRVLGPLGGVPGRLAARNAVRTPRRTAATATALLVGVTLTSTFLVGASSTRATVTSGLAEEFPTDVQVVDLSGGYDPDAAGLPAGLAGELAAVPGVAAAATVPGALVRAPGDLGELTVLGLPPEVADVVRSPTGDAPADGEVRVGEGFADVWGVAAGDVWKVTGDAGTAELVVRVGGSVDQPVVSADQLVALAGDAPLQQVWLALDDAEGRGAADAVDAVTETAAASAPGAAVEGAVLFRQALDDVLDVLLLVVTALLGIAVVIALVGVGNTLALSVVERRQELGLLRALGQPAGGVRRTLLWEAGLVAGVASVLGVGLGVVFGLAGTASALGATTSVVLDVPWLQVLAAVVVATLAGMVASLLPARRAARTPPVAAMAA